MKKLIITAMILFSLNNLWSAPAPFAPSTVKAFADSLYSEGFLTQAEGEYKRYLFSVDTSLEDALSADVEFQSSLMSLCNIYKEQENKEGIVWLKQSFYPYAATTLKEKMNVLQAGYVFKERNLTSFSLLEQDFETEGISFSTDFTRVIKASDFVLNRNIKGLSEFCSEVSADTDLFGTLGHLSSSYKLKSPGLALFLSSIIPGCGRWYTGSFWAFVSSFLSVGSFITGTVVAGINTSWRSWQPYVFGACGLVLYITELYGSYQSAKRYNDSLYRVLCEETEKLYDRIY